MIDIKVFYFRYCNKTFVCLRFVFYVVVVMLRIYF